MIKDKKFLLILILICFSCIFVFYIFPFISSFISVFVSGTDKNGIKINIDKIITVIKNEAFLSALKNTVIFTGIAVIVINVFSFAVALILKAIVKRTVYLYITAIPLAIPVIVTTPVWKVISDSVSVNMIYGNQALISIIVLLLWKYLGFHVLIYLSGINSVPKSQTEAASLDGAGALRRVFYIIIPEIISFFITNIIFSIIHSFRIFREIYLLFGNYPPKNVYLIQHYIQNNFNSLNYDNALSAAYIFFIIIFIVLTPLLNKEKKEENHYGA